MLDLVCNIISGIGMWCKAIWIVYLTGVNSTMTWARRLKIALDAAKGLAFLHCAERSIIYRDFKTSNILLDAVSL